MSKKHFSWLLVVTLIVTLLILFTPGKVSRESAFEVRPLVPGLDARVNEIDRVRIVAAGNRTVATLLRNESGWVVEEGGSYPADWARLKSLMAALAQAEVIEPKTTNPEYFGRLGLSDVADESSTAIKVELEQSKSDGEDGGLVSVLVGNAAPQQEGQYVRVNDEPQALLINRTLDVPDESNAWLEREIIDVSDDEVVEVDITHPDGESIKLLKTSADAQDFTLQGLPEGREIASAWSVNALGGGLSGLELEEVRADSGVDWGQAVQVRVLTADGVEVKAELVEAEEKHWLRLSAAPYSTNEGGTEAAALDALTDSVSAGSETAEAGSEVTASADARAGATAEDAAAEDAAEVAEPSAAQVLADRVATINQRVSGWAYAIPAYKAEVMRKRLEDLLKPVEES